MVAEQFVSQQTIGSFALKNAGTPMPVEEAGASSEATLRLSSETLAIDRKIVTDGTVQVRTVTTTKDHAVEEMLRHRTVVVQRVAIGREIDAMPEVQQSDDLTIVPVVKEVLVVHRQLVLVEEVHIRRVTTKEPFAATVALREQRADITHSHPVDGAAAARPAEAEEPDHE